MSSSGMLTVELLTVLPSFESIEFSGQKKQRKTDFQDCRHYGHLGFSIETILAIFDLQVTLMLPTEFWVNWPFGSGEEAKNRWRPSWISDRNNFGYFWSTIHPKAPYPEFSQFAVRFRRRNEKYIFKMAAICSQTELCGCFPFPCGQCTVCLSSFVCSSSWHHENTPI